ncbi:phage major capsid protein [Gordonia sputi]|uniref:phage major capsid protein n=1 Tax=Gordonia sputi TaxID=36823 RepID=UPI002270939C|nr:phage major capsid protein [Gordonia sputi]
MFAPVFQLRDYASPARSKAALTAATNRAGDISKGVGPRASQAELDDLDRFADLVTEHRERQSKRFDGSRSADNPADSAITTKAVGGRVELPSPSRMSTDEWRDAFECATRRKSFRAELKTKAAISGIGLPAVVDPSLTLGIGYEPDRLFAHIPSKAVDAPVVEYYCHTSNTNPAGVVAELGTKPDLGMVLTPKTATVTKIAALASASLEALTDFEVFQQFIPGELTRAVIDAETAFVAAQILGTSGVLTRAKGASEAALDTIAASFSDLRIGAAYTEPNLVAMHPSTWNYLRTQKDAQGRYLLGADPGDAQRKQIWGVDVVTNAKITAGTALVLDTKCLQGWTRMSMTIDSDNGLSASNFSTNAVTYRAEERIAVGVLRPAGVNVVTGLA